VPGKSAAGNPGGTGQPTLDGEAEKDCEALAKVLYQKESIYLLGKRETLAVAKEAALKMKELNYIHE
jgi:glucosamine 6-phosphate synthetase-like amidotransferase/phosphosugar isomerase protein